MTLERLEVVVDLLAGEPDGGGQHGGRSRLGQLSQQPGADGIQAGLCGGRVVDHSNALHVLQRATDKKICQQC